MDESWKLWHLTVCMLFGTFIKDSSGREHNSLEKNTNLRFPLSWRSCGAEGLAQRCYAGFFPSSPSLQRSRPASEFLHCLERDRQEKIELCASAHERLFFCAYGYQTLHSASYVPDALWPFFAEGRPFFFAIPHNPLLEGEGSRPGGSPPGNDPLSAFFLGKGVLPFSLVPFTGPRSFPRPSFPPPPQVGLRAFLKLEMSVV